MKEENIIEELKRKVEEGGQVTREEALALSRVEDKRLCTRQPGRFGSVLRGGISILARL